MHPERVAPGITAPARAVITTDDIRRLGVTSLPEALRLVPGMQVARINNHSWAVSARGFGGVFAAGHDRRPHNLLERRHAEFPVVTSTLLTEVPRSVIGKAAWRFK